MLLDVTSTSVLNNIFLCLCFAVFVGSYYCFCSFCEFVCVCCAMGFMPEINIYIHTYIIIFNLCNLDSASQAARLVTGKHAESIVVASVTFVFF